MFTNPFRRISFIQLADLLSGVVSFHFNNNDVKDNTKYEFKRLEEHIGESIKSSPSSEKSLMYFK